MKCTALPGHECGRSPSWVFISHLDDQGCCDLHLVAACRYRAGQEEMFSLSYVGHWIYSCRKCGNCTTREHEVLSDHCVFCRSWRIVEEVASL